jgi:two-component system, LytTR family, sensor kinase
LQPHFLFNTLSMIAERVHVDPDGADRMIGRLGQLLRGSLATSGRQEVTLAEELRLLAAYLDIMSVRLSDRAEFSIDVPPDLVECALPALILQPLAENSFSHGIERRKDGGLLAIKARRRDESLEVELADNGGGFDPAEFREGVGLRVVRERLHELYGANGSLSVRPRPEGGTSAMVRVPFRRLESSNGRYVEELAQ